MYAIIEASGKQFRAEADATLRLPSLKAEPGETVTFRVLLAETDGQIRVGQPSLEGASVSVEVLRHGRGKKIIVFKRKRRKGYRRKQGHRQGFTEVRVVDIALASTQPARQTPVTEAAPAAEAVPAAKAAPAVNVTDVARKLAEEHGLDLGAIEGTGAAGRILKGDVERAIREQRDQEGA
ncbi:MAG: 50S ribosomal protein L21 [Gemmatimonadetes bacterium]|nr:50S ribosomal protein L21 [Gemmatimonadota bacterium]